MEGEQQDISSNTHLRRRRRVGRAMREKTPDPYARRMSSTEDDNSVMCTTTASEETQAISMQIRPPRSTRSAHESKILRRRDKTFATAAARSLSQPREAERLSEPEATELIQTVKRSLSMPRNKELAESSEGELQSRGRTLSPESKLISVPIQATADENLSRLEQNLRRFENERKRFENEKKLFEREKREHKMKYKQMMDNEERKRLLQSYRKLSDRLKLTQGEDERKRLISSLRKERDELNLPAFRPATKRNRAGGNFEESSTQFSSSDTEVKEEIQSRRLAKQLSPVRRYHTALTSASVRGPPPQPPTTKPVSRNNSLSPVRPERRSKTPERAAELIKNQDEPIQPDQPLLRPETTTTDFETDRETHLRQRKLARRETLHRPETRRKQSLEKQEDKVDTSMPTKMLQESQPEIVITQASEEEYETSTPKSKQKLTFLQRLGRFFKRTPKKATNTKEQEEDLLSKAQKAQEGEFDKIVSKAFLKAFLTDARQQWRSYTAKYPQEIKEIKRMRNRCFAHTVMLILLLGFGGLMFRYTEGAAENIYKCEVRKVKRDFIDHLWSNSHSMREDDWKTLARQKLRKFEEELNTMREMGVRYFPGQKSWNFVNCILYCWTVITTIGYGHITPKTQLGQSLTIAYAIIGIPMFLILLADFGKLFTRAIKFVWGYVRGLYYTGTCRRIRKQQQVRDAMNGFSNVYDLAIRRPSQFFGMSPDNDIESQTSEAIKSVGNSHAETPTSPYPETIVVDDEFNLPISLASILLITYILLGAFVYTLWEDWGYFEAFYFVFISMSTIGFGDLVPNHPIFMMCSIIYLIFGLALTSMFINVVQIKLSNTFKDASAKIGATLGVAAASEIGEDQSQAKTPSDLASVHAARLNKIAEDEEVSSGSPPLQSALRPSSPTSQGSGQALPPPLMPRKQVSMEQLPTEDKKKKKRFFK